MIESFIVANNLQTDVVVVSKSVEQLTLADDFNNTPVFLTSPIIPSDCSVIWCDV